MQNNYLFIKLAIPDNESPLLSLKQKYGDRIGRAYMNGFPVSPYIVQIKVNNSVLKDFSQEVTENKKIQFYDHFPPEDGLTEVLLGMQTDKIIDVLSDKLKNREVKLTKFALNLPKDYSWFDVPSEYFEFAFKCVFGEEEKLIKDIHKLTDNLYDTLNTEFHFDVSHDLEGIPFMSLKENYILRRSVATDDFNEFKDIEGINQFAKILHMEPEKLREEIIKVSGDFLDKGYKNRMKKVRKMQ